MQNDQEKLITLAKKGDKNAFSEIYRIFLARIFRFIYYLIKDEALAEDLTQDTFVRAWRALPTFSTQKGTLQAYLFRIARNLVIDNQRKRKESALTSDIIEIIESPENLENKIVAKEEKNEVAKALLILDSEEKEAVILRYFEDLSYDEISKTLGKKSGAIRVKVHRALEKLKNYFEK